MGVFSKVNRPGCQLKHVHVLRAARCETEVECEELRRAFRDLSRALPSRTVQRLTEMCLVCEGPLEGADNGCSRYARLHHACAVGSVFVFHLDEREDGEVVYGAWCKECRKVVRVLSLVGAGGVRPSRCDDCRRRRRASPPSPLRTPSPERATGKRKRHWPDSGSCAVLDSPPIAPRLFARRRIEPNAWGPLPAPVPMPVPAPVPVPVPDR